VDPVRLRVPPPQRRAHPAAARLRHALRRCSRGVGSLLRQPHRDDPAAEVVRASVRGVALDLVCATREHGLALLGRELGRQGLALLRERRVAITELALADPGFSSPAGRADLWRRLDALLQPPAAPAATAPRHARRSAA